MSYPSPSILKAELIDHPGQSSENQNANKNEDNKNCVPKCLEGNEDTI